MIDIAWREDAVHYAEQFAADGDVKAAYIDFHKLGLRLTGRAHDAGVKILVGTDIGDTLIYPGFSFHDEMDRLSEAGMSNADILRAATLSAAEFEGLENSHGAVAVGNAANLVFLTANPLEDLANARTINGVYFQNRYYDRDALDAVLSDARSKTSGARVYLANAAPCLRDPCRKRFIKGDDRMTALLFAARRLLTARPAWLNALSGVPALGAACAVFWSMTVQGTAAQDPGAAQPFTAEELLSVPDIKGHVTHQAGHVAWAERAGPATRLFLARAPGYETRELASFPEDDGLPVRLVGFGPRGDVLYTRGRAGFNPAHAPFAAPPALYALREGKRGPKVLIEDLSEGFSAPTVSKDNASLYFARGGVVLALDLKSGSAAAKPLFSVRGRITALHESPDGRKLAFVTDRSGYERGKYAFVGVFDRATGAVAYMEPGLGIDQDPVWSPDSRRLAFIRFGYEPRTWRFSDHREGAPFDVMVADAGSGAGEAVFTSAPGYGSRFNGFFASGYSGLGGRGSLLWLADDRLLFPYERTGWKHLYAVAADGGPLEQITQGAFEVHAVALSEDRTTVYYLANTEDDPARLSAYELSLENGFQPVRIRTGAPGGMPLTLGALGREGIVYEHAGGNTPTALVVKPSPERFIGVSTGPGPDDPVTRRLPAPEVVAFEASDGLALQAVLYRPAEDWGEGRHPVLIHAHGGPRYQTRPVWDPGFGYRAALRYFASRGYYVLSVNFRSGTGYGLDFREPESYGGRGAGDVQDILDAADYLKRAVPAIDPARMAAYGHSYGGHIVTNALARSDVFAAGISSAGVGDWVVEMETDFGEALQFNIPQRLALEQLAHDSSAISRIDDWGVEPLLLLHGDNDRSAAMTQPLELYHALRRRGVETVAVVFPGEDHGIQRHAARLRYMQAMETFLDRHIGRGPTGDRR